MAASVRRLRLESPRKVDKMTPSGRTVGHEFRVAIEVEDIRDCVLEWWEKTDQPYAPGMAANRWIEMFNMNPGSQVFAPWVFQMRVVPRGLATFTLIDPPGIMADKTQQRDLFFDIRVKAAGGMRQIRAHQRISLWSGTSGTDRIELTVLDNDHPGSHGMNPSW